MSVTVFVTHSSLTDMNAEVKLSSELSVADVKKKLESHCGTAPQHQHLTLLDSAGKVITTPPGHPSPIDAPIVFRSPCPSQTPTLTYSLEQGARFARRRRSDARRQRHHRRAHATCDRPGPRLCSGRLGLRLGRGRRQSRAEQRRSGGA